MSTATANPIAISTVIAVMIRSNSTCPSGAGERNHQKPAAARMTPLSMSSSPIITMTTTCWDSAPYSPTQKSAAATTRTASRVIDSDLPVQDHPECDDEGPHQAGHSDRADS